MADLSITIANNVLFVGYNPTSAWNTMVWGTDAWRFAGETVTDTDKSIDFGAVTLTDAPIKDIEHLTDLGSTLLSTEITKEFSRSYNNNLLPSTDISSAYLTDKNGYYYVFIGDVIDADDRAGAIWGIASSTTGTWTAASSTSSIWS